MEEQQALLGRTVRPSLFSHPDTLVRAGFLEEPFDEGGGSSSEGSDSWWGDSHSSCSSCSESSEEDWERDITEEGELLYIEPARSGARSEAADKKDGDPTEPAVEGVLPASSNKQGKFVRWIRRRESKRQRPRLSVVGELNEPNVSSSRGGVTLITIEVQKPVVNKSDSSILGLQVASGVNGMVVVYEVLPDGPLAGSDKVSVGDCLKTLNGEEVSMVNLEKRLSGLSTSTQVTLGFLKRKESASEREKPQSRLVQRLLEGDSAVLTKLAKLPVALLVVNTSDQLDDSPDSDLAYCFPPQSCLAAARGAFVTLAHLMPSVVNSDCRSCTCQVKGQDIHVVFEKEDDLLLLLAFPDKLFRVEEVSWIAADLVRCLQFTHQTLHLCFQKEANILNKFLSSFFSKMLSVGSSGILDVPLDAMDSSHHYFHDFLPAAPWLPLPREAQLQLDDALNELEACDFGHSGEDAQESERFYIILGSCLYHQDYLLVSHLAKDDLLVEKALNAVRPHCRLLSVKKNPAIDISLRNWTPLTAQNTPVSVFCESYSKFLKMNEDLRWLSTVPYHLVGIFDVFNQDVHSFLRQNSLLELSKEEGVSRLVLWREVHPSSVRRGLPPTAPTAYPPPVGRWFLLVVAAGQDMLAVLLESAGCCLPLPRHARSHPPHVLEAEDTLAHIQSLGLTSLASQWLSSQARPRTTTFPSANSRPAMKEKAWTPLRPVGVNRISEPERQEDSASQTASNVSNPSNASESDENAPILGRRAERTALLHTTLRELSDESHSDTDDTDSDWGSFKGLSLHENGSGLFDNPYLPSNVDDLDDIIPSKITSGPENLLFHFVHLDDNEGVVITPGGEASPSSSLMSLFTQAAHNIHTQLQHNVRFRAAVDPRGVVNKSLIAVKECAVLLDAVDNGRPHWVVGRLFFTPKPREVYVCYSDSSPQNMLELAFRLVLGIAG